MSHDFRLRLRTTVGGSDELIGQIPTDDWTVLLRFLDRFDRLAECVLVSGVSVTFKVTIDMQRGIEATGTLPRSELLDALMYRMRPFVLNDEATYFYRVCNIVSRHVRHPAILAVLAKAKDLFSTRDFQRQIRIESNGVIVNADATLRQWLNGVGEYHGDAEKEDALRRVLRPLQLESVRPLFVSMMIDKAKAVADVARVASVVAGRFGKGREVRFGGLNLKTKPTTGDKE